MRSLRRPTTPGALAFPGLCPGCGGRGEPLCETCAAGLAVAPVAPPPAGIDEWVAAFAYEGVARELVARVKYRNARAALTWLAAALADRAAVLDTAAAVVTWVPTTPARRRERGFDHAELLARATARCLDRPVARLLRREPGAPQTGRPRAARTAGPRFTPARARGPASVLLVDDVSTTGASLAVAAVALRASGARYVRAATITRTP